MYFVISALPIQSDLLRQLSGKELVLVPTLTIPVKHNCQYNEVVGKFNVCLAIVRKNLSLYLLFPGPLYLKICTFPILSAFIYIIEFVGVFHMSVYPPQEIEIVGTNSDFAMIYPIVLQ